MATGNNRKENTFKKRATVEPELTEDTFLEEKNIKEKEEKEEKKKQKKTNNNNKPKKNIDTDSKKNDKEKDGKLKRIFGILFLCMAVFLCFAFISYLISFFSGHHQELGNQIFNQDVKIENNTGSAGVFLAQTLIKESFGIGAFYFVYLLTAIGLWLAFDRNLKIWSLWKYALLCLVWFPLFFSFLASPECGLKSCAIFGGAVGLWLYNILNTYTGWIGVLLILIFLFLAFAVYEFNLNFKRFKEWQAKRAENKAQKQALINGNGDLDEDDELDNGDDENNDKDTDDNQDSNSPVISSFKRDPDLNIVNSNQNTEGQSKKENTIIPLSVDDTQNGTNGEIDPSSLSAIDPTDSTSEPTDTSISQTKGESDKALTSNDSNIELVIENTPKEETVTHDKEKEHHTLDTPFDPHYELRNYKFPTLDMLNDYGGKKSEINNEELESNKNKIVETLGNYGILIDKIFATIGPTVTLYEIIPAPGIRISKIKNLEDDIALSLAALGIRIIAPIPGKGTIGIEVPNSKPETVSMRSVLSSKKFQETKYALPCAIGKTISNETYVFDLAKMPHILMAGATGQGKSVGLNAIIASLLYSKHPSELKFVMVDPKKVELTLYNRIERHYLAKLPDSKEAIITDVRKVVRTLNSLCIEMDNRYDLLKKAECRNIIEYNEKFKSRRLLPTEGHRYLPYIVLIVDEFADLIMTAGREVEQPIARLAQLARAIGIHLIIATQRPSVNIITGSIKANFPARIAFRVISIVDSKTILDQSGANQLIGRGDMLLSTGNDLVRLQCAFIDTPEVEAVTEFIGAQRGYDEPFMLPEVPEEEGEAADIEDDGERDSLFEEAARIVVQTQQGSTSMIQRKLKLGYNRAGRIIDQLEAAGIVGPFSGSKSREVKVGTEAALEQILRDIYNKDNGI